MASLGIVGIADKGEYSPETTYNKGNFVLYNGSTYLALKDGLIGVIPADDKTNWKYLAKGFNEASATNITVTDTHGIIDGSKGKKTVMQTLLDSIGDWIIKKAVTNDTFVEKLKERLINNGTATLEGFALDARQGNPTVEGSLAKQISKLNEEFKVKDAQIALKVSGNDNIQINIQEFIPSGYKIASIIVIGEDRVIATLKIITETPYALIRNLTNSLIQETIHCRFIITKMS